MKARTLITMSMLVMLSLTGCANASATDSSKPVVSMKSVDVEGNRMTLVSSTKVVNGKTTSCQEYVDSVSKEANPQGGKIVSVTKATDCVTQ